VLQAEIFLEEKGAMRKPFLKLMSCFDDVHTAEDSREMRGSQ
jgi:hypothetical protein